MENFTIASCGVAPQACKGDQMNYAIAVPPDSVRSFKDPNIPKVRIVHAIVPVTELPTDLPLDPDPRRPRLTGSVAKRIATSLISNDGRFHLLNRGICISARDVELDTRKNVLSINIPN